MAFDIGSVIAHIKGDISDFKSKITEAKGLAGGLKSGIGALGDGFDELRKQSSVLAVAGIGALTVAAKQSLDAFNDSEKQLAQLDAVLKSTKGAAKLTKDEIVNLASSLQNTTTYSDEAVLSAENLLLTFTNIGRDTFPQATKTVLDMSTALGQDTKSSAIQLGKALQDPILGVTALRRVGVNFSKDQLAVIENLVKTGKTLDAQKLILKELNTEFGGSASAQALTFAGRIEILKNKFNDLQEKVGGVIAGLAQFFVTGNLTGEFLRSIGLQEDDPIILGLVAFRDALIGIGQWVMANQELVMTFVKGFAIAMGALMILGTINLLLTAILSPLGLVAIAITLLYTAWQTNFLGIQDITTVVINFVMDFFQNTLMPFFEMFAEWWTAHWVYIKDILDGTWQIIVGLVKVAWAIVYGIISVGLELLAGDWKGAWERVKQATSMAWEGIKSIFMGALNFIKGWGGWLLEELVRPFRDAWNRIQDYVNKIKDALDFTKRHSPSVVDIVQRGVGLVNKSLGDLTMGINPVEHAAGLGIGAGFSSSNYQVRIDLNGAMIGSEAEAVRMGERIGDSIIKKLKMNIRV